MSIKFTVPSAKALAQASIKSLEDAGFDSKDCNPQLLTSLASATQLTGKALKVQVTASNKLANKNTASANKAIPLIGATNNLVKAYEGALGKAKPSKAKKGKVATKLGKGKAGVDAMSLVECEAMQKYLTARIELLKKQAKGAKPAKASK